MSFIRHFADLIVIGSSIYHFIMGLACLLGSRVIARFTALLYKMRLPERLDPITELLLKPLGAFALWTSIVCWADYAHPGNSDFWVKAGLAILFALRAAFRIVYRDTFANSLGIRWERSRWNVAFNLFLIAILSLSLLAGDS